MSGKANLETERLRDAALKNPIKHWILNGNR